MLTAILTTPFRPRHALRRVLGEIDARLYALTRRFGIHYAITERALWLHACRADEGRGVWLAVGSRMLLVSHERP